MKKMISFVAATLVLSMSVFAFAGELHKTLGQCTAFETEVAVWSWDAQNSKFVFEGYTCKKAGGR